MPIDYKELLYKYMGGILRSADTSYLDGMIECDKPFSEEEWEELCKIEEELEQGKWP